METPDNGTSHDAAYTAAGSGGGMVMIGSDNADGTASLGVFFVDMLCRGLTDTYLLEHLDSRQMRDIIDNSGDMTPCSPRHAASMVRAAIEFAAKAGIEPGGDWDATRHLIERHADSEALQQFATGRGGRHHLVAESRSELDRLLPLLEEHLGSDFSYELHDDGFYSVYRSFAGADDCTYRDAFRQVTGTAIGTGGGARRGDGISSTPPDDATAALLCSLRDIATAEELHQIRQSAGDTLKRRLEDIIRHCHNCGVDASNAILLLGDTGDGESLDCIVDLLYEPTEAIAATAGYNPFATIVPTLAKLARNRCGVLAELALDRRADLECRWMALVALNTMAAHFKEEGRSIEGAWQTVLNALADSLEKGPADDALFAEHAVLEACHSGMKALLPAIKRIIDTGMTPALLIEDYADAEIQMDCGAENAAEQPYPLDTEVLMGLKSPDISLLGEESYF